MPKECGVDSFGAEALVVKRRKPVALLMSTLVVATLLLGACGGDDGGEAAAEVTPTVQAAVATKVVEANDAVTETVTSDAGDEDDAEVAVITDTNLVTVTEVNTDVTVTTDTVVIEENEVTTVITDTELVTNVVESSESATTTESEVITNAEELAPEVEVTGTGATTTQPGTAAAGAFTGIEGSTGRSILATTLLDANFETSDGEVGGEIQDVVVDIQNGQILYVLLEYGGVLDVGDTDMPVPLSAFSWGSEDQLTLNIDGEQLQNFPGVSNDWPVPEDGTWDVDVRNFWQGIDVDAGFDAEQSMHGVRRISSLLGSPIAGGDLGDRFVQDIIISLGEGRASYVLIDADEGVGENLYAVPFSTFDATAPEAGFTWNPDFDPTLLEGAPRFEKASLAETRVLDDTYDDEWENFWADLGFPVTHDNN